MKTTFGLVLFLVSHAGAASAQEGPGDLKKRLLDQIRERIRAEHRALLGRVEKIIDEELAALSRKRPEKPDKKHAPGDSEEARNIRRELQKLEMQKAELLSRLRRLERRQEDEALLREIQEEGAMELQDAGELFEAALEAHRAKEFESSIRDFKRIYYAFRGEHEIASTSAYNVACGYALRGEKEHAIDWLEISIHSGFSKYDHMKQDTDLDNLRDEPRFRELMRRGGSD